MASRLVDLRNDGAQRRQKPWARSGPRLVMVSSGRLSPPAVTYEKGTDLPSTAAPSGVPMSADGRGSKLKSFMRFALLSGPRLRFFIEPSDAVCARSRSLVGRSTGCQRGRTSTCRHRHLSIPAAGAASSRRTIGRSGRASPCWLSRDPTTRKPTARKVLMVPVHSALGLIRSPSVSTG